MAFKTKAIIVFLVGAYLSYEGARVTIYKVYAAGGRESPRHVILEGASAQMAGAIAVVIGIVAMIIGTAMFVANGKDKDSDFN